MILTRPPERRIEPSITDLTPSSRPTVRISTLRPLYAKLELRAQDEFDVKVVNREVGQAASEVVELLAVP